MGDFDTVLLGRKTYELMRQQGPGGELRGMQVYVFSRTLRQAECPGVTVSDNPAATLAALKAASGKGYLALWRWLTVQKPMAAWARGFD